MCIHNNSFFLHLDGISLEGINTAHTNHENILCNYVIRK